MVGLDAAEFSFIESNRFLLPNLRRFLDSGRLNRLHSTADILPGSVWPTFYTGKLPGSHGIYHHLQWDPDSMCLRRVSADWLYCEPFWYELERRSFEVASVDVPMTFPSRLARGVEVINWGSHDQLSPFASQPREICNKIRQHFGSHPMGYEIPVKKTSLQLEKIRRNLVEGARRKGKLSRWLLGLRDWDFFITVFGETHRGGHILWPEVETDKKEAFDALLDVYRAVDAGVGEILDGVAHKDTAVILFALHGMGENTSQEHFFPKIMDAINAGFDGIRDQAIDSEAAAKQRSLMRLLREKLPAGLQNAIAQAVPVSVRDMIVNRQVTAGYNWEKTPGFALLSDFNGYLRFNLKGRERRGMIEQGSELFAQYEIWLRRCFTDLRFFASKEPFVSEMVFSSNAFTGPRAGHLPDMIVTWTGSAPTTQVSSRLLGEIYAELKTGRGGNHGSDGFCILLEQGSRRWDEFKPAHIVDLAGIILKRLGHRKAEGV